MRRGCTVVAMNPNQSKPSVHNANAPAEVVRIFAPHWDAAVRDMDARDQSVDQLREVQRQVDEAAKNVKRAEESLNRALEERRALLKVRASVRAQLEAS